MQAGGLPNTELGRTSCEIGLFHRPADDIAEWIVERYRLGSVTHGTRPLRRLPPRTAVLREVTRDLSPMIHPADPRHHVLFETDGWTGLMNNSIGGTDTGLLLARAARDLGCRTIRAVDSPPELTPYPAVMLEVRDPSDSEPGWEDRRVLVAADDGGRRVFDNRGDPFPFEDVAAYRKRRVMDRFTSPMLHHHLHELGVPTLNLDGTYLIEQLVHDIDDRRQHARGGLADGRFGCRQDRGHGDAGSVPPRPLEGPAASVDSACRAPRDP
jgi:hypothetical protein